MSPHIGAIVQILENRELLRGREWIEKSRGTKTVYRGVLMCREQKVEVEILDQTQEQRKNVLEEQREQGGEQCQVTLSEVEETCLCLKKPKELIQYMIVPTGHFHRKILKISSSVKLYRVCSIKII